MERDKGRSKRKPVDTATGPGAGSDYDRSRGASATREAERDLPPREIGGDEPSTRRGDVDHVSREGGGVGSPTGDDVAGSGVE
jgi:hypothetical protein